MAQYEHMNVNFRIFTCWLIRTFAHGWFQVSPEDFVVGTGNVIR